MCFRGAPYNASLLDQGSDNLLIYMQGGGACLSLDLSGQTETATPRGVPKYGVLDTQDKDNPVASWNILYVPYCDGSVFGGDNDYTNPNDKTDPHKYHGVRNFSAALDLAIEHFPNPKKILLAGSSAGGWGTIYHRALVRSHVPRRRAHGLRRRRHRLLGQLDFVADEWGSAKRSRPPSCKECQTDANMSPYVKYLLEHDPGMVVGDFSAWEDAVIMQFTFMSDAMQFRMTLQSETDIPAKAFPKRYKRFFINGSMHTTLLNAFHTTQVNGVTVSEWLGMMIDRDPDWTELME